MPRIELGERREDAQAVGDQLRKRIKSHSGDSYRNIVRVESRK